MSCSTSWADPMRRETCSAWRCAANFDFRRLLVNHLTITGSTLRPRTVEQKGKLADELRTKVWPLLNAAKVPPVIDSRFPLVHAGDAHARMESSVHIGKIILEVT